MASSNYITQTKSDQQSKSVANNSSQKAVSLPAVEASLQKEEGVSDENAALQLKNFRGKAAQSSPFKIKDTGASSSASKNIKTFKPVQKKLQVPIQPATNKTGLPDNLKSGVEQLSGISMDDVKVHFNSSLPQTYQAKAFASGSEIHIGPGMESSLPHEAWHTVQQKQGRVNANVEINNSLINADTALENEADVMGQKASGFNTTGTPEIQRKSFSTIPIQRNKAVMQMDWYEKVGEEIIKRAGKKPGGYKLVVGLKNPEGGGVFETKEQRSTHVEKPKTYAELLGPVPDNGEFTVASDLVRFSQDSIAKTFTSGATIHDTVNSLKSKALSSASFPAIRVFYSKSERLVTLDNRRLWCCQQANVTVKCKWATKKEITTEAYKFTSGKGQEGRTTIEVRN